ncbi:MAG: 50S ribosomal protein L11 methyltransferase [Pseudomonadota bacterium]
MATYTALTTVSGAECAESLGEAMERLVPAPTGVGVFEVEDDSGLWEVGGYFLERPDEIALALLASAFDANDFAVSRVDDRDWVAQVRRELHPVEAGRFTVYGDHDSHRVGPNRIGLRIEAAMAFGTGHHATTRGSLMLFDRLLREGHRPRRVADIGCGTGVLAMAAAKALRVPCVATDIDQVAADTVRANVAANDLGPWVRTGRAAGVRHLHYRNAAPFDLVFANILASPLKRLATDISGQLTVGGNAILAGLLTQQAIGVRRVFEGHGFALRDRIRLGDWTSLTMRRIRWRP